MCEWSKYGDTRIDPCMRVVVNWLKRKHSVVACCCGHKFYSPTIVVKEGVYGCLKNCIVYREIFSGVIIPRTKRFYERDQNGIYFIPEVVEYYRVNDKRFNPKKFDDSWKRVAASMIVLELLNGNKKLYKEVMSNG